MRPQGVSIFSAIFSAMATGGILRAFDNVKQGMARSALSGTSLTSFRSAGAPMSAKAERTACSHSFSNCSCTFIGITRPCI